MQISIDGNSYEPYDVLQLNEGFAQLLGAFGTIYLAASADCAGEQARIMVEGLLHDNPLRFVYNYGLDKIIKWAKREPTSFGFKEYDSLTEWLEGVKGHPHEYWDCEGKTRTIDRVDEDILALLDFEPKEVYFDDASL